MAAKAKVQIEFFKNGKIKKIVAELEVPTVAEAARFLGVAKSEIVNVLRLR